MEQHPVPQHISSYEFRLVGDMTLRQFLQLAGGLVVALIFYASGLPWFLKWPLVLAFALLGVGLAFLPIEERPLDRWLLAFFKAVYSPTQFLWQKRGQKPEILAAKTIVEIRPPQPKILPGDQAKLLQYLQTLPVQKNPLDLEEEKFFQNLKLLFQAPLPPNFTVQAATLPAEPAGERIRRLGEPQEITIELGKRLQEMPEMPQEPRLEPVPGLAPTPPQWRRRGRPRKILVEPVFPPEVILPSTPEIPNILVGMVLNQEGRIIEGAILEIRDENNLPVRALRTNKLGHFRIANPLPNGTYEIETEKESYEFDLVKVRFENEIIPPIEIRAKSQMLAI